MPELYKYNRVKFHEEGQQRSYILESKKLLNLTWIEFGRRLSVSPRVLTDWAREKFNISQIGVQQISKLTKIPIPKNHSIIDWKLHLQKAGQIGGKSKFLKYGSVSGNEDHRKERWKSWWEKFGKYKEKPENFQSLIKIKIPKKNKDLAEFVGIMLGDGGIAPYHVTVTLSSKEVNYISYVTKLIFKLFSVIPKLYKRKEAEAIDIVVQRKQLVDFCQQAGLVLGSKIRKQVDIPEWIKNNKSFAQVCVRGLIDTDGCFYHNSYTVNGKKYSYFKIAFTNGSLPLINSVAKILKDSGINSRISKNKKDVRIEEKQYVLKYIQEIGSSNYKHLEKIEKWQNRQNMLE